MSHLVFTYGTLMQGRSNHGRLAKAKLLGPALTCEYFQLYDNGSFPGMVDKPGPRQIRGELYEIDDETLNSCDRLEGHPHFYIRKEIMAYVWDGDKIKGEPYDTPTCWAYFIQTPFYDKWKKLDGGVWQPKRSAPSALVEAGI